MTQVSKLDTFVPMKLDEYMKQQDLTDESFGRRIGVNRLQVLKYRHGNAKPREEVMQKIHDESDGQVTANDFYNLSQQTPQ